MADAITDLTKILKQLGMEEDRDNDSIFKQALEELDTTDISKSVSAENTLKEIITMSAMYYNILKKSPNNQMVLDRLYRLLELKTKITGLMNLKPEMQEFLDTEVNVFKARVIKIMDEIIGVDKCKLVCEQLAKEGL